MRLGLVLLPPLEVEAEWARYANALVVGKNTRVVLGPTMQAHVTLLHVETDDDPEAIWNEAKSALPATCQFEVLSLGLLRYDTPYNAPAASPGTMAWLVIPCTEALRAMERKAVALSFAKDRIKTGNGDRFQPHATIAIWDGESNPAEVALPKSLFDGKPIEGRLALGIIGANGTYEQSLFRG